MEFLDVPQPTSLARPADSAMLLVVGDVLAQHGFRRNYTFVYDKAGSRYRMLFAHLDWRMNIEVDAPSRSRAARQRRDMARDTTLRSKGWQVVRLHAEDGVVVVNGTVQPGSRVHAIALALAARFARHVHRS